MPRCCPMKNRKGGPCTRVQRPAFSVLGREGGSLPDPPLYGCPNPPRQGACLPPQRGGGGAAFSPPDGETRPSGG